MSSREADPGEKVREQERAAAYQIRFGGRQRTGPAFQNPANNLDVTGDGNVSPIDALRVINFINRFRDDPFFTGPPNFGNMPLPNPFTGLAGPDFLDTNGDGFVSAGDALLVLNFLDRAPPPTGEGEGDGMASGSFGSFAAGPATTADAREVLNLDVAQLGPILACRRPGTPRVTPDGFLRFGITVVQVAEHMRDPQAADVLREVAPVGADVPQRRRGASLVGFEPPRVIGVLDQPVLQVMAVDEARRADVTPAPPRVPRAGRAGCRDS